MSYLVQCRLDPAQKSEVDGLRKAHLAYIEAGRDRIRYGGVIQSSDGIMEGVCYVVDFPEPTEARTFLEADPYYPLYGESTIQRFQQRIPGDL